MAQCNDVVCANCHKKVLFGVTPDIVKKTIRGTTYTKEFNAAMKYMEGNPNHSWTVTQDFPNKVYRIYRYDPTPLKTTGALFTLRVRSGDA